MHFLDQFLKFFLFFLLNFQNLLILDEPTNDLDLNTLRLLEEALIGFSGSSIVVSHDRYFLNRVCTSILAFEGHGIVRYQTGNYDYYLEKFGPETMGSGGASKSPGKSKPENHGQKNRRDSLKSPRKLSYNEQREFDSMEATISSAEEELALLENEFAQPDFHVIHKDDWQELDDGIIAEGTETTVVDSFLVPNLPKRAWLRVRKVE